MARYNEILAGRYNRMLQKLFAMKGGPPVPQLSGDVQPSFNLFSGVENRYLESWQRFGAFADTTAPAAGNRAAVRIRNPANSTVVAVLEKIAVSENIATDTALFFYDAVAVPMPTENATITPRNLDARGQQLGATSIVTTSINFGILGTSFFAALILLNSTYDFMINEDQEITLPPGSELTVAANALVNAFRCSFMWRERVLEESERT
jgi:hypothetical protein